MSRTLNQENVCEHCWAACCRQASGWDMAVELRAEDLTRPAVQRASLKRDTKHFIPYRNGKCPLLDDSTQKCKAYDERPANCREFNCRDCRVDGPFLRANPTVRAMLEFKRGVMQ